MVDRQRNDLAASVLCLRDGKPSPDGLALLVASVATAGAQLLQSSGAHPWLSPPLDPACQCAVPAIGGRACAKPGSLVFYQLLQGCR